MLWLKVFSNLSIGVVIFLSAGFAGLYYLVKYDDGKTIKTGIQRLEKQVEVEQKKVEDLDKELKSLHDMSAAMNQLGDKINDFLQFIPNKMTSLMILNHLTVNAKVSGVDLEDITHHRASQKKEFYEKIKVSVTVKGLFTQILIFLSKLTDLTEVVTVESFNLEEVQKSKKRISVGLREVTMKMDIYGYKYISNIIDNDKKKEVKQ